MSINDTAQKIKLFSGSEKGRGIYYILLITLVAISSFGLGRLSKISQDTGQVSIVYPAGNQVANVVQSVPKAGLPAKASATAGDIGSNSFVASNKGSKYYPIGCSAASSLKEDNKVYFSSEMEAQKAGYTKSISCK